MDCDEWERWILPTKKVDSFFGISSVVRIIKFCRTLEER